MTEKTTCKYCGWEFPIGFLQLITENIDSVFCENCGTELINENFVSDIVKCEENSTQDIMIKKTKNKKAIFNRIYENIRTEKSPINRVLMDSDFPKVFKDNFKIVISRVIYSHIRALEINSAIDIKTVELTKEILDKLYEEISPVLTKRIKREYLGNLHKSSIGDFEKRFKILQTKLKLNKMYHQDFVIYLRRLIKEVYIIVSELWNDKNLPKFERIIRDDLKRFSYSTKEDISSNSSKKLNIEIKSGEKSTTILIDYMKMEITKIAPFNELYQGRLPSWRISRYLGLKYYKVGSRYVDSISNKLKYLKKNPDYKFSQEELEVAKASLIYFFGQRARPIIETIGIYEKSNILKTYPSQQHNVVEPHVFKTLDNPINSYWYGFLGADGSLIIRYFKKGEKYSPKYRVFIELQEQDKILLQQFRDFIQLDPKASSYQIKHREREWRNIIRGKVYKSKTAYLSFVCRPMGEDLTEINFKSSKSERKDIPDFDIQTQGLDKQTKREIIVSWLLGYYVGDGVTGTSRIVAANRQFLEQIKRFFNIKNNVIKVAKELWYLDRNGDLKHQRSMYSLAIGARLFNEMWEVGQKYGLGLKRKYTRLNERRGTYDILLEKLDILNVDDKILQEMVYQFRQYQLVEMFTTTITALQKLMRDWKITLPPNGYWKRGDNYIDRTK